MENPGQAKVTITLEPMGKRIAVAKRTSILQAAQEAGIDVVAVCGGMGACATCKVFSISGEFSPITAAEEEQLTASELQSGLRLGCQTQFLSDCTVFFPPESLATFQRLQLEGRQVETAIEPAVSRVEIDLSDISGLDMDHAADLAFAKVCKKHGQIASFPEYLKPELFRELSENQSKAVLAVHGREIIAVLPPKAQMLGFAVDVGTTKLAGYLVDLETGRTLSSAGATNPQIAYGEDVISRIKYANESSQGAKTLQQILVQAVNTLLEELCQECCISREQIIDCVMVGNTAMHHLLLGFPVKPLGTAPYQTPAVQPVEIRSRDIGIKTAESAYIYLPPNIASFVGGDHVAMLLSTGARNRSGAILAVDIGTNTEISLIHESSHFSCSCASGPAFEGAHIREGLRAIPGAIERLMIDGESAKVKTIQNKPAIGICGSGVLDAVAELRRWKMIDTRGAFNRDDPRVKVRGGRPEFVLVDSTRSGHGRDIAIDRNDVNQIQLAKAAIRSGIEILLHRAQISPDEIDHVLLAGAFATYLDINSAIEIGMFPRISPERFQQVGNAAGSGAREMLVSTARRRAAEQMVRQIQYIELMTESGYTDIFMKAIGFD